MRCLLFAEPFDLDTIDRLAGDGNFLALAHIFLGFQQNWHDELDQIDRMLFAYERAKRDDKAIWKIASLLVQRATTFDDTASFLDYLVVKLKLLPGTAFFEEIKMAHLHKADPLAWQKKKYRDWVDARNATRKIFGKPVVKPESPTWASGIG